MTRSPTHPLTTTQSLQLWRGFYVCLYMHDSKNALSVQTLISTLASTVATISAKDDDEEKEGTDDDAPSWSASFPRPWLTTYSTAFWLTMAREWPNIDQWRMNKVLLLIRVVLRQLFALCLSQASHPPSSPTTTTILDSQLAIFRSHPLSPRARSVPDGLRLHLLDIWVDELESQFQTARESGPSEDGGLQTETLEAAVGKLMSPVEDISKETLSKGVKIRAKEALKSFHERFPSFSSS